MNSIPTVTKNLLIINVLCFFGGVVAMKYGINLNDLLGLHFFMASDFNPAQLITYMFMHGGFQHIFLTCLPCGCLDVRLNRFGDRNVSCSIIWYVV